MNAHPEYARRHHRVRLHDPTRPKPAPMTVAQARGFTPPRHPDDTETYFVPSLWSPWWIDPGGTA